MCRLLVLGSFVPEEGTNFLKFLCTPLVQAMYVIPVRNDFPELNRHVNNQNDFLKCSLNTSLAAPREHTLMMASRLQ